MNISLKGELTRARSGAFGGTELKRISIKIGHRRKWKLIYVIRRIMYRRRRVFDEGKIEKAVCVSPIRLN